MVSILDELITELTKHDFSIPVKDVRDAYESKNPVYPMIVVRESRNAPWQQIHGKETFSVLHYNFEIYGRDTVLEDKVIPKRDIVTTLGMELDEFMRTKYGMKRTGSVNIFPYGKDKSVLRYIATYKGIIDTKYMIIYQT